MAVELTTNRRAVRCLGLGAAVALALWGAGSGEAAPLRLSAAPYRYTVIDQDLTAALQEFGSNANLKLSISPEVRGRVQGPFPELSAKAFLDRLLALYNLESYYDGAVLHVTAVKEGQSRLLVLGPVPFERFRATLEAFGVTDEQFTIKRAPGAEVALASGPPRFVALVEQTLTGLIAEEQGRPRPGARPAVDTTISVFRGSQAQTLRNGEVVYQSPDPERGRPEPRAETRAETRREPDRPGASPAQPR